MSIEAVHSRINEIEARFQPMAVEIARKPAAIAPKKMQAVKEVKEEMVMQPEEKEDVQNFTELFRHYAKQYQLDPDLVTAIAKAESGFDPQAVSVAGAKGLMQLMPGTAKELGVTDLFDPAENIAGGAKYFKGMLDRYGGNTSLALAAYNAGAGNVDKYGGVPPFAETKNYVDVVQKYYQQMKQRGE